MYMIGECATDGNETLASKCRRESPHNHDYLMDVPVFSTRTRRMYANVFCAKCNSDVEHLTPWNVTIRCDHGAGY